MRMREGMLAESRGSWPFCGHLGMLVSGSRNNLDPRIQNTPRGVAVFLMPFRTLKLG